MAFMINFLASLIITIIISLTSPFITPTTTCAHQIDIIINSETPSTISAAPALLPNPPISDNPYTELSPDIAPLLPSPARGGSTSSIPTIPSDHSPPNPDGAAISSIFGPDTAAFSPTGSLQDSSAGSVSMMIKGLNNKIEVLLTGLLAFYFLAMVDFHGMRLL